MYSRGGSPYSSPYRSSIGARKDYTPSVSGHESSIGEFRQTNSLPRSSGESRHPYSPSPRYESGDVSVAPTISTNVLNNMIDSAIAPTSRSSTHRHGQSAYTNTRSSTPTSYARLNAGSSNVYHRPHDVSSEPRRRNGYADNSVSSAYGESYAGTGAGAGFHANSFQTRDPSPLPMYRRDRDTFDSRSALDSPQSQYRPRNQSPYQAADDQNTSRYTTTSSALGNNFSDSHRRDTYTGSVSGSYGGNRGGSNLNSYDSKPLYQTEGRYERGSGEDQSHSTYRIDRDIAPRSSYTRDRHVENTSRSYTPSRDRDLGNNYGRETHSSGVGSASPSYTDYRKESYNNSESGAYVSSSRVENRSGGQGKNIVINVHAPSPSNQHASRQGHLMDSNMAMPPRSPMVHLPPTMEERLSRGGHDGLFSVKSELTGITGINTSRIESHGNPSSVVHSIVNQAPAPSSTTSRMENHTNPASIIQSIVSQAPSSNEPMNSTLTTSIRSVVSAASVLSAWHNEDILMLPKASQTSEAAIAATAVASLIVDDQKNVGDFETAVKALSTIVEPTIGSDDISIALKSSIIGQPKDEHSHIPVSYAGVQESMERSLMVSAALEAEKPTGARAMNAYEFWARCTLLVSAAILKADPSKTQLAHTASEIVMAEGTGRINVDWLDTADEDMEHVSNAVRAAIVESPDGGESMAQLASLIILSEGGKALAMERIRRAVPTEQPEDYENQDSTQLEQINEIPRNISTRTPPEGNLLAIRNSGSLMDNASDDSSEEGNGPSVPIMPTRSLRLTLSAEKRSEQEGSGGGSASPSKSFANQRPPRGLLLPNDGRKEELTKTLNKLLSSPDDEGEMAELKPPFQLQEKQDDPVLKGKREEIAQRVQRIQMRAAAARENTLTTQVPTSNEPSLNDVQMRTHKLSLESKEEQFRSRRISPRKPKERKKDDTEEDGVSLFAPVFSFLAGLNCAMDEGLDFYNDDESKEEIMDTTNRETKKSKDNEAAEWASFKQEVTEKKNDGEGTIQHEAYQDPPILKANKGVPRTMEIPTHQANGTHDWEMLEEESAAPGSVHVPPSTNLNEGLTPRTVPSSDGREKPRNEMVETSVSKSNSNSHERDHSSYVNNFPSINGDMPADGLATAYNTKRGQSGTSMDSGAFSDVFERGQISNIPIKKLSLSPPDQGNETSQGLFLRNARLSMSDEYTQNTMTHNRGRLTPASGSQQGERIVDSGSPPIRKKKTGRKGPFSRFGKNNQQATLDDTKVKIQVKKS